MSRPVLRVVMIDPTRTENAFHMYGEREPYQRRLVTIELTEEQARAVQPRRDREACVFEQVGEVWLEMPEAAAEEPDHG